MQGRYQVPPIRFSKEQQRRRREQQQRQGGTGQRRAPSEEPRDLSYLLWDPYFLSALVMGMGVMAALLGDWLERNQGAISRWIEMHAGMWWW